MSEERNNTNIPEQESSEFVQLGIDSELGKSVNDETIHSRFSGMNWIDVIKNLNVTIIGAGGIGSWTAMNIARLGVNSITIYDDDKVDIANISGQYFDVTDLGKYKTDCIVNKVTSLCPSVNINGVNSRVVIQNNSTALHADIVILAVDNMLLRNSVVDYFSNRNNNDSRVIAVIDGRLSVDELQIYTMITRDKEQVSEMRNSKDIHFSDDEAFQTVCNIKQTSYMANMIGGFIANIVVNIANSLTFGGASFVPFYTSYSSDNMILENYDFNQYLLNKEMKANEKEKEDVSEGFEDRQS